MENIDNITDSDKLKYYENLDNQGLVTHIIKPEDYLSVREIIELLFNIKLENLNLETLESGSQIRRNKLVQYKQHYIVLCNKLSAIFKKKFGKSPHKFKLKFLDPGPVVDRRPTSCSVYPPSMFSVVEEYIKKKPIDEWYDSYEKIDKKEIISCDCGCSFARSSLKRHLLSEKHKKAMEKL